MNIEWDPSPSNDVKEYWVYRNGVKRDEVSNTSARVTGISGTEYEIYVKAVDSDGNISDKSNTVTGKTTGPRPVRNLKVTDIRSDSVSLIWDKSPSDDVSVYRIYKDREPIKTTTTRNATVENLENGTQYEFYIRAVDREGNLSTWSNRVNPTTLMLAITIPPLDDFYDDSDSDSDIETTNPGAITLDPNYLFEKELRERVIAAAIKEHPEDFILGLIQGGLNAATIGISDALFNEYSLRHVPVDEQASIAYYAGRVTGGTALKSAGIRKFITGLVKIVTGGAIVSTGPVTAGGGVISGIAVSTKGVAIAAAGATVAVAAGTTLNSDIGELHRRATRYSPEGAGKALTSVDDVASYIQKNGKLPDNFITKDQAKALGWDVKKGNLADVAPGKSIGGDVFKNKGNPLPDAPGRVWYEADVNYTDGFRGTDRILYSNDGLIYKTFDHYKTFTQIK